MTIARLIDRLGQVWLVLAFLLVAGWVALTAYLLNSLDADSREIDLAGLWAGARMALDGKAAAAFDPVVLKPYMGQMLDFGGGVLHWRYPANLHVVIAPLGLLPFSAAFVVVVAASIVAIGAVFRHLGTALPGGLNLILSAPVLVFTLMTGQIAALFMAALTAGLVALARGQLRLAGLCLGLLCLKPSLVPLALVAGLAGRHWGVVGWAAVSGAAFAILGTFAFGIEHWGAFLASLSGIRAEAAAGLMATDRMVSPFALFRTLGVGLNLALSLHTAIALALAVIVGIVWSGRARWDLKGAALALAIPLATPYAHFYELVFTLPAIVLLARAWAPLSVGRGGLLALLWLCPLPGLMLPAAMSLAVYAPPILLFAFALTVLDALRQTQSVGDSDATA